MKHFNTWTCFILIVFCYSVSYSQGINTGVYSGVNFSNIHGEDIGGKWVSKSGPVQGFYLGFSFNKTLGIQTGINFTTVYYEHKTIEYSTVYYPVEFYGIPPIYYFQRDNKMDFSFLRVPVLFTVCIPSVVQFIMRTELIFSFLPRRGRYLL